MTGAGLRANDDATDVCRRTVHYCRDYDRGPWGPTGSLGVDEPTSRRSSLSPEPAEGLFLCAHNRGGSVDHHRTLGRIRPGRRRPHSLRHPAHADGALARPCAATGSEVYLKHETRQTTGSYKERGALNAMLLLSPQRRECGVVTASAGNHGQAVAYHGTRLNLATTVVMPRTTPFLKVRRTRDYGAEVVLEGDTFDEAAQFARDSPPEPARRSSIPSTIPT